MLVATLRDLYPNAPAASKNAASYYLNNFRVSTPFNQVDGLHASGHKGIDFAGLKAGGADGKDIPALVGGKVEQVFVNNETAGHGVVIRGSDGRQYRYIHMKYKPNLKVGQTVSAGQNLGQIGNTGRSSGPHLDLKVVDTNGNYIDPMKVINSLAGGSGGSYSSSKSTGSMVYKVGSSGDVVEQIQRKVGTYADGKYGNNTKNAVEAWQRRKGLKADGVVGPETLKAMGIKGGTVTNTLGSSTKQNSPALMNRNSGGNYRSSYTNNWKTQKEASKAAGYKDYKRNLQQAIQANAVPMSAVQALTELIGRESTWNHGGDNPTSSAWGYGQFLDSTRREYKKKYPQYNYNNPVHQIILTYKYAVNRYGSVEKALKFWDDNNWY